MTFPWYVRWWPSYEQRCATFTLRCKVHRLEAENAAFRVLLERAQVAVQAALHDILQLRSEPCNLRRNDP